MAPPSNIQESVLNSSVRVAVVGTGANGASIGADLTRAGVDVTFIEQWPEHVEAMRRHGIRIDMPGESVTTQVRTYHLCEVATLRAPFDVVFLVVKAYDTRWACELIKPLLSPDGLLVGLQNGMTVDAVASVVGPRRTIGAVIEIAANMFTPGVVERQVPPAGTWFAVGAYDESTRGREEEVAELLRHAGSVEVADDIRSAKWMKLVANAAEVLPSAILDLPLKAAVDVPGVREVMYRAGREALRTALALGHRPVPIFGKSDRDVSDSDAYADALFETVLSSYSLPDTRVAVLQDWMKGRRGEVDDINGVVVAEQRRLGGDAPVNRRLVELAHRIENGELKPDPSNAPLVLETIAGC
ncbi:2-dehydropantoate 2-reductase [Pseudonocardia sp.]|uniref:ketopantoate reductase family protein n=1 Tax=Pseudonocardia sp. TaxID=60912 RepID=UPI0031FE08CF